MKTKQQIELEILSLKDKIRVEKHNQSNIWGHIITFAKRADYQTTIKALEWVISEIQEPLTIKIDGQQTQLENNYNS
jgi:hypothetical protein